MKTRGNGGEAAETGRAVALSALSPRRLAVIGGLVLAAVLVLAYALARIDRAAWGRAPIAAE